MKEFLKRGAKVKIVNNKGQTPLSLAAGHLLEETVQLIEAAEEAQKDVCCCYFVMLCYDFCYHGSADCIKYFIVSYIVLYYITLHHIISDHIRYHIITIITS